MSGIINGSEEEKVKMLNFCCRIEGENCIDNKSSCCQHCADIKKLSEKYKVIRYNRYIDSIICGGIQWLEQELLR